MLNNLSALLALAAETETRLKALRGRREAIRLAREKIFAEADPDDDAALQELGKHGAQDHLLGLQMERCGRELAGLSPTLLAEVAHIRQTLGKRVRTGRDKLLAELDSSLAVHYPNQNDRARIMARPPRPPAVVALERHLSTLDCLFNPRDQTELDFGRQFFGFATRALEAIGE